MPPNPSDLTGDVLARLWKAHTVPVLITKTNAEEESAPWRLSLVRRFLGRPISLQQVQYGLGSLWSPQQDWEVFPMKNGFSIFCFTLGPPWRSMCSWWSCACYWTLVTVFQALAWCFTTSSALVESPWSPPFALVKIGHWFDRRYGRSLIRLDELTEMLSKGCYSCVTVEVDLSKPLLPCTEITIEDSMIFPFWQSFEFENVHLICRRCGCMGASFFFVIVAGAACFSHIDIGN